MGHRNELYRLMQGLITVYKPPCIDPLTFKRRIARKLAHEFNNLPWDSRRIRTDIVTNECTGGVPCLVNSLDTIDNPLVIGKQFESDDFALNFVDPLPECMSGIQVMGVGNKGSYEYVDKLYHARFFKSYHLTGMLGQVSSNGLCNGSLLGRTRWRHVTRAKLCRVLLSLEFKARSASLLQAGILPNTQRAFEVLSDERRAHSPLKPISEPLESLLPDQVTSYWDRKLDSAQPHSLRAKPDPSSEPKLPPYLNTIRCIDFKPPFFTLEVQVAYETDTFFIDLMANIGAALRSSCLLSKARRLRHGPFGARNALLMKECTVPSQLYDRLVRLRSKPPAEEYSDEDDYRHHTLSLLTIADATPVGASNVFTNLVQCSNNKVFQASFKRT